MKEMFRSWQSDKRELLKKLTEEWKKEKLGGKGSERSESMIKRFVKKENENEKYWEIKLSGLMQKGEKGKKKEKRKKKGNNQSASSFSYVYHEL